MTRSTQGHEAGTAQPRAAIRREHAGGHGSVLTLRPDSGLREVVLAAESEIVCPRTVQRLLMKSRQEEMRVWGRVRGDG